MKKMRLVSSMLVAGLIVPLLTQAQGTLYVSNLGQTPTGSAAIGSNLWIAQRIITGNDPGGYALNSVQLLMDGVSGSPSGFNVSLYSFNTADLEPGNSLSSLSGPDPSAGGIFTYTASGLELSPSTSYLVVVTAETPIAQGAYVWSIGGLYGVGSDQWEIYSEYFTSPDGSSWTAYGRQGAFQLGIYATAIPEPATLALTALGLVALSFRRHRSSE